MSPREITQNFNDYAATSNGTLTTTANIMSYHYGHLAANAIESVIYQTKKFDVIRFFDDGVGDCSHLVDIYPEVEFILRPTNLGIIENFNDALDRTTTDRVMFLGADNWLIPWALESLQKSEADIISYHGWKVGEECEYWSINQAHGSSLYNVKQAKAVGGYSASGNEHTEEDSILFDKMVLKGASLEVLPVPLLWYRWRHRKNYNK